MQDVQNIPNPDVNSTESNEDFGSHSEVEQELDQTDVESPANDQGRSDIENPNNTIPVPPDTESKTPVREPSDGTETEPVGDEGNTEPKRIA